MGITLGHKYRWHPTTEIYKQNYINRNNWSFHVKSPNALNGSDPDFDENAYIWSL